MELSTLTESERIALLEAGAGMAVDASTFGDTPKKIWIVDIGPASRGFIKRQIILDDAWNPTCSRRGWFEKAVCETSAKPKGSFKQAWTMTLLRRHHKCQLPRGFFKKNGPVFIGC